MLKAYQFRLNPSHHQRTLLLKTLETCRWVYNETLAMRKTAWEQEKQSLSLYETNKRLTGWKVDKPELREVHSQVLQNVQARVDLAFQAFFRRVRAGETPGYPRFRGRGRYDSFTFKQSGFSIREHQLILSKIGAVKIVLHRPLAGQVKTLTVRRDAVGNWYACFACDVPEHPLPRCNHAIGVDVGLESFITLSNGEKVANPRFFRQDEQALAKAQRRLSKAEKGTPERAKRRKVVAHNCPACGLKIDRDENAALNILALGLESLGVNRRSPAALTAGV